MWEVIRSISYSLNDGIIRKKQERACFLSLVSAMGGHSKKMAICKPEREASPEPGHGGTLVSASRTTGNIFLLFRPSSLWQSSPSWLRPWIKPEHLLCQGKCRLNVVSLLLFLLPTIAAVPFTLISLEFAWL